MSNESNNRMMKSIMRESFGGMKMVAAYIMLIIGWVSLLGAAFSSSPGNMFLIGFSMPWFILAGYVFFVRLSSRDGIDLEPTNIKVVGWTRYDERCRDWRDVSRTGVEWADAEQAIVNEIRRKKYKFGGHYHQYGKTGCPVMSDGSLFMISMRGWGDIMSRVWGGDYCEYAWSDAMGRVPPQMRRPPPFLSEEERKERDEWRAKEALAIAKEIENTKNTPPRLDDLKKFLVDNEPEKE